MREALAEASRRGVKVSLLMNSFYSCDLRNGQRDLFRSLVQLLEHAPSVQLWVVTIPSRRSDYKATDSVPGNEAPAFLHSKYVVVDSKWSAVGSWNLWTRAAFYEMEAEIFVHSKQVASCLEEKFEREKKQYTTRLNRPEDCMHYHPTGCSICHQFGPFFIDSEAD
jgi:phosphatidylserine/phosphatidylglycerophosphate/cardiolipin synthase-like enzyme